MYSFLTRKHGVDAEAPEKPEKRAHLIPLAVPIGALLKALPNAWKESPDKLRDTAPGQFFLERAVAQIQTAGGLRDSNDYVLLHEGLNLSSVLTVPFSKVRGLSQRKS
jgi:hypothetical protein